MWVCKYCSEREVERFGDSCSDCLGKILARPDPIPRHLRRKKTHFDKCDVATETRETIKNLEANGALKTPEQMKWAKDTLRDLKDKPPVVIDYQVHGHPNFDKDFKHPAFIKRDDD